MDPDTYYPMVFRNSQILTKKETSSQKKPPKIWVRRYKDPQDYVYPAVFFYSKNDAVFTETNVPDRFLDESLLVDDQRTIRALGVIANPYQGGIPLSFDNYLATWAD